jgi:hypothetical protein
LTPKICVTIVRNKAGIENRDLPKPRFCKASGENKMRRRADRCTADASHLFFVTNRPDFQGETMQENLRDFARNESDEALVRIVHRERDNYTADALRAFEEELRARNLDPAELERLKAGEERPIEYKKDDFVALDKGFSQTDMLLVDSALRERRLPFYVDSSQASGIFDTEGPSRVFSVHVYKERLEEAKELIAEHFTGGEAVYSRKDLPPRERLKAVSFSDVGQQIPAAGSELDVQFSAEEREAIAHLGDRLLLEADKIEAEQGQTLFYYDSLDDVLRKLRGEGRQSWTVNDVLAIMEILQTYAADPAFPPALDDTVAGLLDFLGSLTKK